MSTKELSPAHLELMELAARVFQRLGIPRSTGQIYGVLFASPKPLSLDDIAECLAMSKTSASTGTRQLLSLSMIRQVWMPGERKDYFEARTDIREVIRANYHSFVKPRLDQAESVLRHVKDQLEADHAAGRLSDEALSTTQGRLQGLVDLQKKLKRLLPIAERLL